MRIAALILMALGLIACPPVVVWQSGGSTTACQDACAQASKLGCPEGHPADCAVSFTSWDQGPVRIRRPDTGAALACADVASATTVAQLQAMGLTCTAKDAGASE